MAGPYSLRVGVPRHLMNVVAQQIARGARKRLTLLRREIGEGEMSEAVQRRWWGDGRHRAAGISGRVRWRLG